MMRMASFCYHYTWNDCDETMFLLYGRSEEAVKAVVNYMLQLRVNCVHTERSRVTKSVSLGQRFPDETISNITGANIFRQHRVYRQSITRFR